MRITRRAVLLGSTFVSVAGLISACANAAVVSQQVADDVHLFVATFQAASPALQDVVKADMTKANQIAGEINDMVAAGNLVVAGIVQAEAKTPVEQIGSDYTLIRNAVEEFPLPPAVKQVLDVGAVMLPLIQLGVGMVLQAQQTKAAAPTGMTPDQARAVMRDIIKSGLHGV